MLKKSVLAQIAILMIEITIGSVLLNQFDQTVKMVHATVGIAVLLSSCAVVYFALREKVSLLITTLAVTASTLTVVAFIGGKLTALQYEQGVMLMRISAVTALIVSMVCFYMIWKTSKRSPRK